ncbi:hypothetical protein RMN57_04270 [Kitasatospora sp. CM 4170]|uniref:Uncharacterized protein n=1 Tax=Kitasatospora aburaviensis TaxID=67265 RepID=A0ABW1ET58_9ACTN|nr:hypothetical protein [Kitasatospora sp. CM 4170]WNM43976.1 hypothetical protein RMN57_04270 [Kitasatospora sp. CM 4170]
MLLLGLLLMATTGAFAGLLIADNLDGGPDYTASVLGNDVATLSSLGVFLAGIALALLFCLGLAMILRARRAHRRVRLGAEPVHPIAEAAPAAPVARAERGRPYDRWYGVPYTEAERAARGGGREPGSAAPPSGAPAQPEAAEADGGSGGSAASAGSGSPGASGSPGGPGTSEASRAPDARVGEEQGGRADPAPAVPARSGGRFRHLLGR